MGLFTSFIKTMINGNAEEGDVLKGKTFFNKDAKKMKIGTLAPKATATPGKVLKGYSAHLTDLKNVTDGTLVSKADASVGDVIKGKKVHLSDLENAVEGTLVAQGNFIASDLLKGKKGHSGDLKTAIDGSLELNGTSTPARVFAGDTFHAGNSKTRQTGTYVPPIYQPVLLWSGTGTGAAGSTILIPALANYNVNTDLIICQWNACGETVRTTNIGTELYMAWYSVSGKYSFWRKLVIQSTGLYCSGVENSGQTFPTHIWVIKGGKI